MSVRVERNGPVTTVILDRPEVRNAVDRETGEALADAFREFAADDAEEALAIGLANRVVAAGESRAAAEALAAEITRFPQGAMRGDRRSAIEGAAIGFDEAMANEFAIGVESLEQGIAGARRFAE